jgi:hypothetical protein
MFAIDSIRRDHMSCYGYPRLTTPYLDQIAKKGTLIENSFSAYIPTTPAYSSILTGRDVFSTRMVSLGPKGPRDKKQPTLPEILRKAGYVSTCVGFDGGFYRGFDQYLTFEGWPSWEDRPARKAENLNAVAVPALEKMSKPGKPFLLFLRHMDPHAPYLPPPPYDQMFYSKDPCDKRVNTMKPVFAFKPNDVAPVPLSASPPSAGDGATLPEEKVVEVVEAIDIAPADITPADVMPEPVEAPAPPPTEPAQVPVAVDAPKAKPWQRGKRGKGKHANHLGHRSGRDDEASSPGNPPGDGPRAGDVDPQDEQPVEGEGRAPLP